MKLVGGWSVINGDWLIHSITRPFPPNHQNIITIKAMNLQFWDNVHHPLCVMCHMSGVTFYVLNVTCHKAGVTCHMLCVTWHHYSQTVRDRDLKCWGNIHHPLCVTCRMLCVLCHMSNVMCMCHKSHVTCHVSHVTTYLFLNPTFGHVSGARWWWKRGVIAKRVAKGLLLNTCVAITPLFDKNSINHRWDSKLPTVCQRLEFHTNTDFHW